MSDSKIPRRLLDSNESSDPLGRSLLSAARNDRLASKRASALVSAVLASSVASTAAGQDTPKPAQQPAVVASRTGTFLKMAAVAVAASSLVFVVMRASRPVETTPVVPTAVSIEAPAASPRKAEEPANANDEQTVSVTDLPTAKPSAVAPPKSVRDNAAPTAPASTTSKTEEPASIEAELAELRRARMLLREGHADEARTVLDAYAKSFPHGTLTPEADALAIEAAVAAGHSQEARTLADTFLTKHPTSPQAPRVRILRDRLEAR